MGTKIESCWLRINNHDVHYVTAGKGSPIVLLHGGANDWHEWEDNIDALSRHHRILAPDIIGFGLSDKSKGIYRLADFINFTRDFISALQLERTHLIGHSLGARICLDFAFHFPERVDKLVLIALWGLGRLSPLGYLVGIIAWASRKLAFKRKPYPSVQPDETERSTQALLSRLERIDVPSLIVWGRRDMYIPVRQALKAYELLRNSRLEIFTHCGHAPQREDSQRFNKLVLDFLAQSAPPEVH